MVKVLVTESIADAGLDTLRAAGITVDLETDLTGADLLARIAGYEGLIIRSGTKVTADVIDAASKLQVIGRAGIGLDNVDTEAATRRGILVVNAPQSNIISAAEQTLALLLAVARRIPAAHESLRSGKWEREKFLGVELHDKILGIVGLGRVGMLVAQRCLAFGMRVIATDPYVSEQRAARLGIVLASLEELLPRADVISVHVTKTAQTKGLIGRAELENCKLGVIIINTARGGIVDEQALADAISAGRVAGAGLDVFESEPPERSPLFEMSEVVVTPHLGASTVEAQDKAGVSIAEQVGLALRGEFVPHAVNMQASADLPEDVRAYLGLASTLGELACALAGSGVSELEVQYQGTIAEQDTRILTLSVLKGFLQGVVHEPVTFVNAPLVAEDRELKYSEHRSASSADYTNLMRVVVNRKVSVAGTLGGRGNQQRLVEIDSRPMEIAISRHMAFFRYGERPGVVHAISGPLAREGISIRNMVVAEPLIASEPAVLVLSVDSPIAPEMLQEMMDAASIDSGRFVELSE